MPGRLQPGDQTARAIEPCGERRGRGHSGTGRPPIPLAADLICNAGEPVALVGPSGSGKTTILRAIAGLYRPHKGYVSCGGKVWLDTVNRCNLPPHIRRVGLVFQSYALFPHMTALGNVVAALAHRPSGERVPARPHF